jgi:heat shock protein HtpX
MNTSQQRAHDIQQRHRDLATGKRALPSLFLRSVSVLALLYGALTLLLITAVEFGFLSPNAALIGGVFSAIVQFIFGPWILDLSLRWLYKCRWIEKHELPDHLQAFVQRVCDEQGIPFPSFAMIEDGAPQAFTYGHIPSNARIVISKGLLDLLEPEESEAVVAHEIGHICHWDMVVMTVAQLVPLIAYYIYRTLNDRSKKRSGRSKSSGDMIALGAYIVYIVSEMIVLWFSRVREYYADEFAGEVTKNPSALASALVKIGYGLAASGETQDADKKKKVGVYDGALGALNIFDKRASLNLVISTNGNSGSGAINKERVKDAVQWDLWNPWAMYYELFSTHPLIAKRLERLGDQAASMRQSPYLIFDRTQPESYWDEFVIDLVVTILPTLFLVGSLFLYVFNHRFGGVSQHWIGLAIFMYGMGYLVQNLLSYKGDTSTPSTVAELLKEVKVSPVRPVAATLRGTVVGKGVPGLIFSEDFVMRDETGIIFLDYRQPFSLWEFIFGILKASSYQGQEVTVAGWFRRAPVPYFEISTITLQGDGTTRRCYSRFMKLLWGALACGLGIGLLV